MDMDLSTRLSYLFGTEEYVSMRRQLVLLREIFMEHTNHEQTQHVICSGSLGEGVVYPESDDDIMFSQTNCRVVMTYREATRAGDVLMVPSEFSPGYCRLLDVRGTYHDAVLYIMQEIHFLSSSLWKQSSAGTERVNIHGPCLTGKIGNDEYDYAITIPCYTWPDVANDWILRNRYYEWPSCEIIQYIVSNGCHVVPIGDADSPFCQHEWRISFSVAERTLMHSFNHTQFLVYNLLRLTLKRVIEKSFPGVLCSYFMKTTLFYTAENTPMELWRVDNLEACFRSCISVLYDYIDHTYCPNYFIPEYNMIKRKINRRNRHQMLDILRTIHTIGCVGIIHQSKESSCLDVRLSATIMEYKLDRGFMFSHHYLKLIVHIEKFFYLIPHENIERCMLNLYEFWGLLKCFSNPSLMQNGVINVIWNTGINSYCLKMMDLLSSTPKMNKHNYRLNRTLEPLLRIGFRANVTSGKLTMATYMYMVGKTEAALYVIRQLLSEYPPYVIDRSRDELKVHAYMDVMCARGYNISYKMRHAHAPRYRLNEECINAFPSSLKMWITIMKYVDLDPLTYAYFLESLCHVLHRKQHLLMKSLKCLVNHMDDVNNGRNIVYHTRMCVSIMKYTLGDGQSACRWLGSVNCMAYTLPSPYNKMFSRSALIYLACLLNKKFQQVTPMSQYGN